MKRSINYAIKRGEFLGAMSLKIHKELFPILAIATLFIDKQIHYFTNTIARIINFGLLNALYYLFIYGIMVGFVILIGNKIRKKYLFYSIIVLALLGVSACFSVDARKYITEDLSTILYASLWSIYVCMHSDDMEQLDKIVEYSIKTAGLMMCICFPINELVIGYNTPEKQYMSMSYMLLTGAVGYLYYGITKMKVVDIVIGVIQVIELCVAGARGPLLCVVAIVFISAIRLAQSTNYKATVALVCIGILGVFIIFNLENLIYMLSQFGVNSGMDLRLINMIQSDSFFESKSTNLRSQFQVYMKDFILDNPFGAGVYSDRVLGERLSIGVAYAHNILYEILMNYGIIFGGTAILLLFFNTIRAVINSNTYNKATIDILISLVLVKLFVSSSYWLEPLFFVLIFLLYRNRRETNMRTIKGEEII